MKQFTLATTLTLCLALIAPTTVLSEDHQRRNNHIISSVETLSPGLRELLSKEMLAIQQGMMSIIPAYAAGQWDEIENIAHKIKNSYILKQNLSESQRHELHAALPESFIALDQQFHYLAGMLEHAAAKEKPELVGFYFSRLSDSCIACHRSHAPHKFSALATDKQNDHSH